jgi:segregation and condensation protein B
VTDRGNDLALVEAALFLSAQPMSHQVLAKLLGDVRHAYVDRLLEDLAAAYEEPERGIELAVSEGSALLRVKHAYVDRVAHLAPQRDIPRPVLRTLAVVAYNHPMTQADLVRVRGNKAYGHVQELVERGLIRSEPQGRTLLLHVTAEFLRHFGLSTVEEFRFHVSPPERADASEALSAEEDAGRASEKQESPTPDEEAPPTDEERVQSEDAGGA